jgi:hypothetical protein
MNIKSVIKKGDTWVQHHSKFANIIVVINLKNIRSLNVIQFTAKYAA